MAEMERDEQVSAGYRALGGEEPPRALDEAILAASRRSPRRWRVPLSIAAVLVLAVGVTLRMLPQRPEAESVALAPQVMPTPRPAAPAPAPMQPKPAVRAEAAADVAAARAPQRAAAPTAMGASVAEEKTQSEVRAAQNVSPSSAPAAASDALRKRADSAPTPEAWLARIADLRKQGRTREADESLAEFKKRYPDYKIPESPR